MDFAQRQQADFDKWLRANEEHNFKELRELIVLEQSKQSLPKVTQTYLNNLNVKTVFRLLMQLITMSPLTKI